MSEGSRKRRFAPVRNTVYQSALMAAASPTNAAKALLGNPEADQPERLRATRETKA